MLARLYSHDVADRKRPSCKTAVNSNKTMQCLKSIKDVRGGAGTRTVSMKVCDATAEPQGSAVLTVTEAESFMRAHTIVKRSERTGSDVIRER